MFTSSAKIFRSARHNSWKVFPEIRSLLSMSNGTTSMSRITNSAPPASSSSRASWPPACRPSTWRLRRFEPGV